LKKVRKGRFVPREQLGGGGKEHGEGKKTKETPTTETDEEGDRNCCSAKSETLIHECGRSRNVPEKNGGAQMSGTKGKRRRGKAK